MEVERTQPIYPRYITQDPLWLHLEQLHRPLFEIMCDFDNPYDIEELYDYNEEIICE